MILIYIIYYKILLDMSTNFKEKLEEVMGKHFINGKLVDSKGG
jgi:hypothetical protein